ncbi:hypothetical protein FAZ95_06825 [Trinickia violacea]|uniref:LysR substrate-binding domain-containing protein n=1 Tax=Trinickia violacea TaxID=2571746 RepID=A0A4P8ILY3_9BURK|nr:hypothetical protein FAZ95_06825 [Trinickia violacea]
MRVSVPLAFGHHCVAPVLQDLARKHPQLKIDISITDRMVDLVEEGFDLAVRIGKLRDSASLAARRLGEQYGSIAAAPSYLARHGMPTRVEDLARHQAIAYSRAGVMVPWDVCGPDGKVERVNVEPQLSLDDVQAIVDAAIAGLGLASLPCWLLNHYVQSGELVAVMERCIRPPQEIHVVWPQTRYLPLKTRYAIDALVAAIPPMITG